MINLHINTELELCTIGSLLTDYVNTIRYFDNVIPEYFTNQASQMILTKAKECYINKSDFTGFTAMEHLKSNGFSEEYAKDYVLKSIELVSSNYELCAHIRMLKDLYNKRKLQSILNVNISNNDDFEAILDLTMQKLYDLRKSTSNKHKIKSIGEVFLEYFNSLNDRGIENRCDTGFPLTDIILQGMGRGQLIGLASRPGVGKSALAINIGMNVAKSNKSVAIFSQEMEDTEILERILAKESSVSMNNLINKLENLPEDKKDLGWKEVINKSNDLTKLPFYMSDITRLTTSDIKTECLKINNLGLIIIDYLQLMNPLKREEKRYMEIGQITRELKIISTELGCPILLLCQLNREKSENEKPSLRDLRDSGNIEQDLVKSIMLWNLDSGKKRIGLTINKNRRGQTGNIELCFNGDHMTFNEVGILKDINKPSNSINWSDL